MRVLDASALLATFLDEPGADEVDQLLRDPSRRPIVSVMNLAEVTDRLIRHRGIDPHDVVTGLANALRGIGLEALPVDEAHAFAAGGLRARHYHRTTARLSLADCVALATAMRLTAVLATSDPALASTAQAEGVEVDLLPNSRGERPALSD